MQMHWIAITGLFLGCILAVMPVGASDVTVSVTDYTLTPEVLMPDQMGIVTVTLRNSAESYRTTSTSCRSDPTHSIQISSDLAPTVTNVYLKSKNGVKVLQGNSQFEGDIGPNQSVSIPFLIHAPDKDGVYFLEFIAHIEGGETIKCPIPVNVATNIAVQKQPALGLNISLPNATRPGDMIPVEMAILNKDKSRAEEVRISVLSDGAGIAPSSSGVEYIPTIPSGESVHVPLTLITERTAQPGIHTVPVKVTYLGMDGELQEVQYSIFALLKGSSELGISAVETNPVRVEAGTPFDLTVRIENTGTGDARSIRAMLTFPSGDTHEIFVGKIKSGNDAPALFMLDGMKPGVYPCTLIIRYTDDWGTHTLDRKLDLRVPQGDDFSFVLPFLVVIVVAGVLGYRYMRKNGD